MLRQSCKVAESWPTTLWRRARRTRALAIASLALVVLLLPGRWSAAAPAHFWISTSDSATAGPESPTIYAQAGARRYLHIWARPMTGKHLKSFSLDVVTMPGPDTIVDFEDGTYTVDNPVVAGKKRFQFTFDSTNPTGLFGCVPNVSCLKSNADAGEVMNQFIPDVIGGDTDGDTLQDPGGLQGISFTAGTTGATGIGGTGCHPDDRFCVETVGGPAWHVASVGFQTVQATGQPKTKVYLQIGYNGMMHQEDQGPSNQGFLGTAGTDVVFGVDPLGMPGPLYNAGGDPTQGGDRGVTLFGDDPDALIRGVTMNKPGDANLDDSVDTADYNLWLAHLGVPPNQATWNNGNFSGDPSIDTTDYNIWLANVGLGAGSGGGGAVPEPATPLLTLIACWWIACRRRQRRHSVCFTAEQTLKKRRLPVTRRTGNLMLGLLALVISTLVIRPPLALAQSTVYWDINEGAPGAGGATPSGIWSSSESNWSLDPFGSSPAPNQPWVTNDFAVFSAGTDATGAFTVTVSEAQTAGGVVIEEGSIAIAGNSVNIGTGTVVLHSGTLLSTDSAARIAVSSGGGYIINGPATLRTTNPGAAGSFIDSDATILTTSNLTIDYQVLDTLNIISTGSVISGPGELIKTGGGVIAIASASTYAGATTINDGELRIRTSANRLPIATAVTVNSPGILNLNAVNQQIGSLSGGGRVGLAGATLTVGNSNNTTFSGTIEVTANAGAAGSAAPGGNVTKVGTGTLTLTGANTYTGTTMISAGTLQIGNGGGTGSLAGAIVNNAALTYNRSGSLTQSALISGSGTVTKSGTGTLIFTADNTYSGATTISAGTLQLGNGGGTGSLGSGGVVNNSALSYNRSGTLTQSAAISGSGTVTKSGTGTLILSAANTYTGTTTVSAGTLQIGNGGGTGSLGSGGVVNNSALVYNRSGTLTQSAAISGSGTVTKQGSGTLTLTGANTYTGTTTISAGTMRIGNGGSTGSVAGPIVNNAVLEYFRSGTLTQSATISGSGAVFKQGSGTVTLSGAHTYTGQTEINAGTLAVNGSIPGSVTVNPGGTLAGGANSTIGGSVTNNGVVAPGSSAGVTNIGGNYTQTASGVLEMEVTAPGTFDQLNVTGTATLGGILRIVTPVTTPGVQIPIMSGNVNIAPGTWWDQTLTVGNNGDVFFYTKKLPNGNTVAQSTIPGDMNMSGAVNTGDVDLFALALVNPDKYHDTMVIDVNGDPMTINNYGFTVANFKGDDRFDFDDIDGFLRAMPMGSGAMLSAEAMLMDAIEALLSVPEPDSIALSALGIVGAAAFVYRRGGRLPTVHTRNPAT